MLVASRLRAKGRHPRVRVGGAGQYIISGNGRSLVPAVLCLGPISADSGTVWTFSESKPPKRKEAANLGGLH